MKLKNKKTEETGYYLHTHRDHKTGVLKVAVLKDGVPFSEFKPYEPIYDYDSLAELNAEWEDYEEPKNFYIVEQRGTVGSRFRTGDEYEKMFKEIGNYFEIKEEAEKAVEKLKAWKRLKDKGFEFKTWGWEKRSGKEFTIWFTIDDYENSTKDLDLLFGGKE